MPNQSERERLLSVLRGEIPDRTPWYADLSYWYDSQKASGKLDPGYEGEKGYLRLHQDAGVGIYLYPPAVWKEEFAPRVKISQKKEGNLTVSTINTPLGELRAVQEYLPHSFSLAYKEHYIKKAEDLKIMRYIFDQRSVSPDFADFIRVDSLWGSGGSGLPALLAPCCVSPLQSLLTRWAGIETTIFLLADDRAEVERTIAELEEADNKIFEIICQSPARLIVFPDNLSGEISGRNLMTRYEIPYWQKRVLQLHQAGKFVMLHNDGTLKASLPLLAETDLDAVESVTPAPVGDLNLKEIKEICRDKIIVWGGLPGALFSSVYPEDYFQSYLAEVLETFPVGSGFVLASADQVPPDAEFERICQVRDIVNTYGLNL